MEKRYQVFVSSTYEDLKLERQTVMHALLELDCIPAGMELFPAADDDQWSLIKSVIDDCDYYVLILGGRYGSVGPDGMGYTEKEYRYALETGKPIAAFTHREPGTIPAGLTEQTDEGKQKLSDFRKLVRKRMCKAWQTPDELAGVVSRSILHLIKRFPAIGWTRADSVADATEVLRMKRQIELLESQLKGLAEQPPEGAEIFAQGDDIQPIAINISTWEKNGEKNGNQTRSYIYRDQTVDLTWDEIFGCVGPSMIQEATERDLSKAITSEVQRRIRRIFNDETRTVSSIEFVTDPLDSIIVQLRALGLIAKSIRPRSVKDTNTYWTLTPYGDRRVTELLAITKDDLVDEDEDYDEDEDEDYEEDDNIGDDEA